MVFATAEARWFFPGLLPDAVVAWHREASGACGWEERTDHYLRTAAEDLGVKLRERRIEPKRRTAVVGAERFSEEITGRVERWRKWSYAVDGPDAPRPADWIAVRKRRLNQSFADGPDGVHVIPSEEAAAQGCNLEVGELTVEDEAWWSVCLESWGADEAALPDTLRRVASHVFQRGTPPVLPLDASCGYPAWLREALIE